MEHYEWKNFVYIGHSLGVLIGKTLFLNKLAAYIKIILKITWLEYLESHRHLGTYLIWIVCYGDGSGRAFFFPFFLIQPTQVPS